MHRARCTSAAQPVSRGQSKPPHQSLIVGRSIELCNHLEREQSKSVLMDTDVSSSSNADTRSIFAVVSLIIGIIDLPTFICGFFGAFGFGQADSPIVFICLAFPVLLCLGGIVSGIIGLGSRRKIIALIGIVLPGICLLIFYNFITGRINF